MRAEGYYWVKLNGRWDVGLWHNGWNIGWFSFCWDVENTVYENEVDEIIESQIKEPDK